MRLGNLWVCVCVCVALTQQRWPLGVLWPLCCVYVHVCLSVQMSWASERAWVSHHQLNAEAHSPYSHTLHLFLLSWHLCYPVLTHLPPRPEIGCSSLSLSTYPLLEWVTRMTMNSVCLYSSCFILLSPLVQFVCLCRLKCWKCWNVYTVDLKSNSENTYFFTGSNLYSQMQLGKQVINTGNTDGWMDGWTVHPQGHPVPSC